jgi:hypothetical protein
VLTASQANELRAHLEHTARPEWARLKRFVRYARGRQRLPWLPENVEGEYRELALKSASNWLDLVIRATSQGLNVDGYGDSTGESLVWREGWQANGMDARQHALNRAVLTLGYSYNVVMPADGGGVWIRPESATSMFAEYADPNDEWPVHAIRQVSKYRVELYDAEARYSISTDPANPSVEVLEHGLGECPVVIMRSQLDLLGTPMGEVEPVIAIQDRIVDATFTLQMVAKYGAFPQRWIAGIDVPSDADGNPVPPEIRAYVDHILMARDPDTKFGQFAAADLRQYVDALEAHIRHLAAVTQTPPHYLLGSMVNLSADALAAAETGLMRKIREKREVLGEGYEQTMRLAALALGDELAAFDTSSQVHWQDVESRSLAQVADALLKLGQLGVPAKMLFQMIPGWTQEDAERAANEVTALGSSMDSLLAELEAGMTSPDLADI